MSGGAFDYFYSDMEDIADMIEEAFYGDPNWRDGDLYKRINSGAAQEAHIYITHLYQKLRELAPLMREVEWLASGDTGIATFLERCETYKDEKRLLT